MNDDDGIRLDIYILSLSLSLALSLALSLSLYLSLSLFISLSLSQGCLPPRTHARARLERHVDFGVVWPWACAVLFL